MNVSTPSVFELTRCFGERSRTCWYDLPGGVPNRLLFQVLVHLRLPKGGITREQQPQSLFLVSFHHRLKEFLPALGVMDVAGSWRRPFAIPELVERKEGMTDTFEVPVVGSTLLMNIRGIGQGRN